MKLSQHSAAGGQLSNTSLRYELLELGEFDRIADEARAIAAIFGPASPASDPELPLFIVGYDRQKVKQHLLAQRDSLEACLRPIVGCRAYAARGLDTTASRR